MEAAIREFAVLIVSALVLALGFLEAPGAATSEQIESQARIGGSGDQERAYPVPSLVEGRSIYVIPSPWGGN